MRPMLAFAIPALFTALSFFLLKLSDRFFLLHYQGKAEVGLYTSPTRSAQPLYLALMAFRMAWPQWHYARLNEPEEHKKHGGADSTYFIALNALLLARMGAFMPLIIHVFLQRASYWTVGPTTVRARACRWPLRLYFVFWVGSNVAKKNRMIPVFFVVASAVNIAPQLPADPGVSACGPRPGRR